MSERFEGNSAAGAEARATTLCSAGSVETRTMMQSCASAAKLRDGGPSLFLGMKAMGISGLPLPRIVRPARARLRAWRAACRGRMWARALTGGGKTTAPWYSVGVVGRGRRDWHDTEVDPPDRVA